MLGILHFRKLTKMVGPTNATTRINPHGYSHRPFRLFASAFTTIRIAHFDYSGKPSRLLALTNDIKKALDASRTEG